MALVSYDPAVDTFAGKLGGFVFYKTRSARCVRVHVVPRNPRTGLQQQGRRCFAEAVRLWQDLEPYKRLQWNRRALVRKLSGYSLFISEHMKESWGRIVSALPLPSGLHPGSRLRFSSVRSGAQPYCANVCRSFSPDYG